MGDLALAPDANEITAALDLLKDLPLEGAIVTGDAIFAQRALSRHIREAGGHYLFTVKSNQPTLRRDIETAFGGVSPPPSSEPPPDLREAQTVEKGHGRIETRRIALSSEAVGYLDWPRTDREAGAAKGVRGRESVETAYLITSLPPDKAGPERMLACGFRRT